MTAASSLSSFSLPVSRSFTIHTSIKDLIPLYDGFILDQYGVLHNGQSALPGAAECVSELATTHGKSLIILSNTSSPATAALARLPHLGLEPSFFRAGAVTSGDEAARYIRETYQGKKALWLTWKDGKTPRPRDFLELCGDIEATDEVAKADFVLLHGCEVIRRDKRNDGHFDDEYARETSLGEYVSSEDFSVVDSILEDCHKRQLPMLCCNPDYVVVQADGTLGHMPGKIAARYNGPCKWFGKPHCEHFEACLRKLNLPKDSVVHVGDSLHHDILGANSVGIASVLVTGGIHCIDLTHGKFGEIPTSEKLNELFDAEGIYPTHVIPSFTL